MYNIRTKQLLGHQKVTFNSAPNCFLTRTHLYCVEKATIHVITITGCTYSHLVRFSDAILLPRPHDESEDVRAMEVETMVDLWSGGKYCYLLDPVSRTITHYQKPAPQF